MNPHGYSPCWESRVGQTVYADHQVTTFNVTVRHMNACTPETIKRILESKLEVLNVEEVSGSVIVTKP